MLEQEEKLRFVNWLERTATDNETMQNLPIPDVLKAKFYEEAKACRVVAGMLRSSETMSVRGGQ